MNYEPYKSSNIDDKDNCLIKTIQFNFDPYPYAKLNRDFAVSEVELLIKMKSYISYNWPKMEKS